MASSQDHCSFVLLAEFDILEGAALKYQFPQPLGVDEVVLAMSMLPDGADTQLDDWTMFFLNQKPFNTIQPVLALETPEYNARGRGMGEQDGDGEGGGDQPDLLCVLNLVRTKHDRTLERGARVRAMAICTPHPFIQIFKPVLLMAMDHYFSAPSQDCLADLFDAVNAMDLTGAPLLTRHEKIVMRSSERKDLFIEKFLQLQQKRQEEEREQHQQLQLQQKEQGQGQGQGGNASSSTGKSDGHRATLSVESQGSFEEGIMMRNREKGRDRSATESMVGVFRNANNNAQTQNGASASQSSLPPSSTNANTSNNSQKDQNATIRDRNYIPPSQPSPPSDTSFSLGGSAVWVGDDSTLDGGETDDPNDNDSSTSLPGTTVLSSSTRGRRSTDASSSSHSSSLGGGHNAPKPPAWGSNLKDTHFYHTTIQYKGHQLPIKMPLTTFPEEVGDYTLIPLIKTFSSHHLVSGPSHPHLHTSGAQTHPIIILFNALVTGKRIIFMGHKRPAGQVSSFVLSACALGSGCGQVLRGFIERAFPYANLNNKDEWESVPGYIAGVTNLIFQSTGTWDVLFDIASGQVMIHKDINLNCPSTPGPGIGPAPLLYRTGTIKAEGSLGSEDITGKGTGGGKEGKESSSGKTEFSKGDSPDHLFIEDIRSAIEYHYGESAVRMRFTDYVLRFVRMAARYETIAMGVTKIGFPTSTFIDSGRDGKPTLGSGWLSYDESTSMRELAANANRIEGWRRTNTYANCIADFNKALSSNAIKGFDVVHQLQRLRHAKQMSDMEADLIMRCIADNLRTYEQVIELLSYLTMHGGGLAQLSLGLFHQGESVRESTIDILDSIRAYPVGVLFIQSLNHFQRFAYVRQAHAREREAREARRPQSQPPPSSMLQQYPNPNPNPLGQYGGQQGQYSGLGGQYGGAHGGLPAPYLYPPLPMSRTSSSRSEGSGVGGGQPVVY